MDLYLGTLRQGVEETAQIILARDGNCAHYHITKAQEEERWEDAARLMLEDVERHGLRPKSAD